MPRWSWKKTRLRRLAFVAMAVTLLSGSVAAASLLAPPPVMASGSYNNADIATDALSYTNKYYGQCWTFARDMIYKASGGTQDISAAAGGGDYFAHLANAGGTQITSTSNLAMGDIVQIGQYDTDPSLHTFIIVKFVSGSTFDVVDANHLLDGVVHEYNRTVALGSDEEAFRFGTAVNLGNKGPRTYLQDYVIWRYDPSISSYRWYVAANNNGTAGGLLVNGWVHGSSGDIPLTCDVNGDGISDMVIYRIVGGEGTFYAESGVYPHGQLGIWGSVLNMAALPGDIPVVGDFNGDGLCDFGIYRVVGGYGYWFIDSGSNGAHTPIWNSWIGIPALPGDIPVAGDVDGDGIWDYGIWRLVNGSTGTWYIDSGASGQHTPIWNVIHGSPGDIPIVGDVNGDGIADYGIYRSIGGTGYWYFMDGGAIKPTTTWPAMQGGWAGDVPLVGNFG